MISELARRLASRPKQVLHTPERIPAAVLIPCFIKDNQYHILFIQRTDRVRDHKGQISFPGGAHEPEDATMLQTALREAEEEIGLRQADVHLVGELDDMATAGTRYVISPFVGLIRYPYGFKVDEFETEEVFDVPVSALLEKTCMEEGTAVVDGEAIPSYYYRYGQRIIWGATARILKQLLDIVCECVDEGASLEAR